MGEWENTYGEYTAIFTYEEIHIRFTYEIQKNTKNTNNNNTNNNNNTTELR
jgi:hypothetical protein